jgi:DNA invertase Pin-like site-specific DNA recombinase
MTDATQATWTKQANKISVLYITGRLFKLAACDAARVYAKTPALYRLESAMNSMLAHRKNSVWHKKRGEAMKRAAIYLRVSTQDQTTSNQEHELRQAAERAGWQVAKVYKDHGISGAKGRNGRPAFDTLCRDATKRQFDVVMAWNVDRLGRSLKDLVAFLSELHALGIDLFLHQQGLDTTTPSGKAMFQMLGVFAEFEHSIIQERVRAGLQRAKREGKRLGRPPQSRISWLSESERLWRVA